MIAITLPHIIEGEAETLLKLQNIDTSLIIHIRKPEASPQQVDHLLEALQLGGANMGRLTIHNNEDLALMYALGGIHKRLSELNTADPGTPEGNIKRSRFSELSTATFSEFDKSSELIKKSEFGHNSHHVDIRLSASAHTWEEVDLYASKVDYLFLSPIFDSISKVGYGSKININQAYEKLSQLNAAKNIVALGGIDSGRMWRIRRAGFCCAAVLGALWVYDKTGVDIEATCNKFATLLRRERAAKSRLQFISDGDLEVAEQFLIGGGGWIQLRMKDATRSEIIERGALMLSLCNRYGALLIINDSPHIVKEIGAHGVHLGRSDMSPPEARIILGESAIIGSTANTFEHIEALSTMPIDYIGLGPYRFTTTKSNLSPILGLEGYKSITKSMEESGIHTPIVAIGGIDSADVEAIMECGVSGIAVSGALCSADDVKHKTEEILDKI